MATSTPIKSTFVVGSALCSLIVLACAPTNAGAPPRLTSFDVPMYPETDAERALHRGDVGRALETSERDESATPNDPWAHYDRAVALEQMGHASSAAKEYREAETLFAGRSTWGKSISIFGRAHVLAYSGRCAEAKAAYAEYAAFVRGYAPRDAEMARREADECVDPVASDPIANQVANAVVGGDFGRALALAPARGTAWLEYDRAIAIYGRAHALAEASRCAEAKRAYEEYAALVRARSPHDADMALAYASRCRGPYRW